MRDLRLGVLAGLTLTAAPSAVAGTLILWLAFSGLALLWLRLPPGQSAVGGLLAVGLHWLNGTLHQLGHAWAARRTGHPMQGIYYWGVLSFSRYPANEGELPAGVHIRRALGGPAVSLAAGLAAAGIAAALFPLGGLARYLPAFAVVDSLGVDVVGALLPLPFTDGGSLLRWWNRQRAGGGTGI
jgi:hypothetical protein